MKLMAVVLKEVRALRFEGDDWVRRFERRGVTVAEEDKEVPLLALSDEDDEHR